MTNYFHKAKQLTDTLHANLDVPVVWGGIQPTVEPDLCLDYADIVCIGEGEQALADLAACIQGGQSYAHIPNLGYKTEQGQVVVNPPRPLIQDLDQLPFPDFGPEGHYLLHRGRVVPLTPNLLRTYLMDASATGQPVYPLLATRGCPHRCSYCANDAYADLYRSWRKVRRRSNASLIAEIQAFRAQFPFVGEVAFLDDVFVAAPTETIEAFARLYKASVGLPFYCIVSPLTINEPKLKALLDAGLIRVSMGIQTGSPQLQELYHRRIDNEVVLKAAHLFNRHQAQMLSPVYDIITDNPYATPEDQLDTLRLLNQLPRPYKMLMFSLVFYPGTALYEKALAEGLIEDVNAEVYSRNYFKLQPTYYNLALYGFHRQFPPGLLRLMSHKYVFRLLSASVLRPLWRLGNWLLMGVRVWYNKLRLKRFRQYSADIDQEGHR